MPCVSSGISRCRRSEVSGGGKGCLSHIGAEDDTAGRVIDSPSSATITLDGDPFYISPQKIRTRRDLHTVVVYACACCQYTHVVWPD